MKPITNHINKTEMKIDLSFGNMKSKLSFLTLKLIMFEISIIILIGCTLF